LISLDPAMIFGPSRSGVSTNPATPTQVEVPRSPTGNGDVIPAPRPALEHRDTMMQLAEQMGEACSLDSHDDSPAAAGAAAVETPVAEPAQPLTPPAVSSGAGALDDLQATLAFMLGQPKSPTVTPCFSPTLPNTDDAVASALNEAMASMMMVADAPAATGTNAAGTLM